MVKQISKFMPMITINKRYVFSYIYDAYCIYPLPEGLTWDIASDVLINKLFYGHKARGEALKKLLAQGAVGIIVHDQQKWAAHAFFSPPGIILPKHISKRITNKYWWLFYMHTKPEFRGRGLQKACIYLRLNLISKHNKSLENIMIDSGIDNILSLKNIHNAGFRQTGVITSVSFKLPKIGSRLLYCRWDKNELLVKR